MSESKRLERASQFQPLPGEANFPPPIDMEVVGGVHIAPECITREGDEFVMIVWPNGLPRHETKRTVRFPHGLMRFGETIQESVNRLVGNQLGMRATHPRVVHIDSYVDEQKHWHIEPWIVVDVTGKPRLPPEAEGVVRFRGTEVPEGSLWDEKSFEELLGRYLSPK